MQELYVGHCSNVSSRACKGQTKSLSLKVKFV